ncbi:hypothetical protein DERF_009051 [Dermatophagoides farinae]|uniref:Uncharacterized protein n=1 Tax=Dermatophagoides farinae TaxID=6954 RepID=A0A922HWG9_DERFA|nr:hypothetical protein DERF_009051 [Dermatophagoides farinae]
MKGKKLWKYVIDNNINDSEDPSKFMAMAFIVRTVDETNFHRISGCDSAKQMMDKLIQYHRGCSSKSTEGLLQKFYEISWSDDIEATFSEVRRINGELKARGVLKTSSELCSKILSILPTSFNEVKCSVKATKMITGKEITLEQLESLVRSVHKMQKSNDSDNQPEMMIEDSVDPNQTENVEQNENHQRGRPVGATNKIYEVNVEPSIVINAKRWEM